MFFDKYNLGPSFLLFRIALMRAQFPILDRLLHRFQFKWPLVGLLVQKCFYWNLLFSKMLVFQPGLVTCKQQQQQPVCYNRQNNLIRRKTVSRHWHDSYLFSRKPYNHRSVMNAFADETDIAFFTPAGTWRRLRPCDRALYVVQRWGIFPSMAPQGLYRRLVRVVALQN